MCWISINEMIPNECIDKLAHSLNHLCFKVCLYEPFCVLVTCIDKYLPATWFLCLQFTRSFLKASMNVMPLVQIQIRLHISHKCLMVGFPEASLTFSSKLATCLKCPKKQRTNDDVSKLFPTGPSKQKYTGRHLVTMKIKIYWIKVNNLDEKYCHMVSVIKPCPSTG